MIVININDNATVIPSDQLLGTYFEGNGSVVLDPGITIMDPDPVDIVTRLVYSCTRGQREEEEEEKPDDGDMLGLTSLFLSPELWLSW